MYRLFVLRLLRELVKLVYTVSRASSCIRMFVRCVQRPVLRARRAVCRRHRVYCVIIDLSFLLVLYMFVALEFEVLVLCGAFPP